MRCLSEYFFLPKEINNEDVILVSKDGQIAIVFIATPEEARETWKKLGKILDSEIKKKIFAVGPVITVSPGLYDLMTSVSTAWKEVNGKRIPAITDIIFVRVGRYTGIWGIEGIDIPKEGAIINALLTDSFPNNKILERKYGIPFEDVYNAFFQRKITIVYEEGKFEAIRRDEHLRKLCDILKKHRVSNPEDMSVLDIDIEKLKSKIPEPEDIKIFFSVEAEDITEAYVRAVRSIEIWGKRFKSSHGETKEILYFVAKIKKDHVDEDLIREIGESKESLDKYREGLIEREEIKKQVENIEKLTYTYGERMRFFRHWEGKEIDQLELITEKLVKSPNTRRAVIVFWDPERDITSKDPPCLNYLNVFIRDEKVYGLAIFRSHDIGRAYIRNVYGLFGILDYISKKTGKKIGELIVISSSAHVYSNNYSVFNIVREYYKKKIIGKLKLDEKGNIIIKRRENSLTFILKDNKGNELDKLEIGIPEVINKWIKEGNLKNLGGYALTIGRKVIDYFMITNTQHALYVGEEVLRALLEGMGYEQL